MAGAPHNLRLVIYRLLSLVNKEKYIIVDMVKLFLGDVYVAL